MLEIIQTILLVAILAIVIYKFKPTKTKKPTKAKRLALLDSCALIDGRIVELVKAGFVPFELAVPEFIVAELQLLADGNDSHKRERARFGLEVIQQLQHEQGTDLQIERTKIQADTTDEKLVKLAKNIGADLYTTDFNLNQVASIEGVRVLNVNELSHALRPIALPGEDFEVKVLQAGSNREQGVGYMDDGTMIVIDNARKDIGKKIMVNITRTHQTIAGKMLFAQKVGQKTSSSSQERITKNIPTRNQANTSVKRPLSHSQPSTSYKPTASRYKTTKREASLFKALDEADIKR